MRKNKSQNILRFTKRVLSLQRVKFLTARQKYEKKARCANVEQSK